MGAGCGSEGTPTFPRYVARYKPHRSRFAATAGRDGPDERGRPRPPLPKQFRMVCAAATRPGAAQGNTPITAPESPNTSTNPSPVEESTCPPKTARTRTTSTTVHRVYRLGEGLRQATASRRRDLGLTLATFLAEAVEGELPGLVEDLRPCLPAPDGKTRPARLPLTQALLGLLRQASADAGVPAAKLLAACLTRAAARKRRRRVAPPRRPAPPRGRLGGPGDAGG